MLDTGCAVKYNIEFRDDNNVLLGTKSTYSTFICDMDYGKAASVIMWATFNSFRGNDSEVKPLEITKGNTPFKIAQIYEI